MENCIYITEAITTIDGFLSTFFSLFTSAPTLVSSNICAE